MTSRTPFEGFFQAGKNAAKAQYHCVEGQSTQHDGKTSPGDGGTYSVIPLHYFEIWVKLYTFLRLKGSKYQ